MIRSSGVLLPIFSLPGPFGHGGFGPEALQFAKFLKKSGIRRWLVLPFAPPGGFNSPYQCSSSFAGNPAFIDPRELYAQGLINAQELEEAKIPQIGSRIDYGLTLKKQKKTLQTAFRRLGQREMLAINEFLDRESYWIDHYRLFMSIKEIFGEGPFWDWPDEGLRNANPDSLQRFAKENEHRLLYYSFEQYEFSRQWAKLKEAINEEGISLIGDLPIYPAADSADFWGRRELFETGDDGMMSRVAGVPPDYFSEEGQRWGNPLYRWDVLQAEDYHYWLQRIDKSLEWYDMLRLDHFRGFESYWAVPAGDSNAINGQWEKGPAMDLFNQILKNFPGAAIIAEDLGDITSDVRQFLQQTGLPGMKVFQFAFSAETDGRDRLHRFVRNLVAFTGTHDNDTNLGWARSLSDSEWAFLRDYLALSDDARDESGPKNELCRRAILALWQSVADLVIVPVQDLLGLGGDYRINLPGSTGSNWEIRFTQEQLDTIDSEWLARIGKLCERD